MNISVLGFKLEDAGETYYSYYADVGNINYDVDRYDNHRKAMPDYEVRREIYWRNLLMLNFAGFHIINEYDSAFPFH